MTTTQRLQSAWNGIEDAERRYGVALAALADDPATAAALAQSVAAYGEALRHFRDVQVDLLTALLLRMDLMEADVAALKARGG